MIEIEDVTFAYPSGGFRLRLDVTANAAMVGYQQITPDNIESFHFNGTEDDFPATAASVVLNDTRAGSILRGRYLDPEGRTQMFGPASVVQGLVDWIFRIKTLLDVVTAIIAVAAFAALGLAVFLGYRLRAPEIATAVKLGACRGMVLRPLVSETVALLFLSSCSAAAGAVVVSRNAEPRVGWLLALGT